MPPPPVLTSFLAHEPATGHRAGARVVAGGAGYAVVEQAEAVARVLAAERGPRDPSRVVLVAPRAPTSSRGPRGVSLRSFAAPDGALDELAVRYVEDRAWRDRFRELLGDGPVLAHHLPAARVVEALGLPSVVAMHSLWPTVRAAVDGGPPGPRADACARLLGSAAAVVVATRAERDLLLATAPAGVADVAARVHVVPLAPSPWLRRLARRDGLARRRAAWRARLVPGAAPHDVVLAVVGRVVPYKGVLEAVASFVRVARAAPRARLLVVGPPTDAPYAARVAAAVEAAPRDVAARVHLVGPQRLEAAPLASDVLVHLSRIESFSRTLDEAALLGRPAVVAASPVLAERVGRGRAPATTSDDDVLWLEDLSPAALDAALLRAATDGAWRSACGAASARRVEAVAPDAAARALLAVWRAVGDSRACGSS